MFLYIPSRAVICEWERVTYASHMHREPPRKGSVASPAGAVAAAAVGGGTLATSFRCGATLLAFYFSSSRLTALAEDRKDTDDAFKAGGRRDWLQVRTLRCCCSQIRCEAVPRQEPVPVLPTEEVFHGDPEPLRYA